MIRLPPSAICLAPSDVFDYEDRRKGRKAKTVQKSVSKFEVGALKVPTLGSSRKSNSSATQCDLPIRHPSFGGADSSEDRPSVRVDTLENFTVEVQQASSPTKDIFHYSGFVESPSAQSSPFSPEDYSTPPQNLVPPGNSSYRPRTLPRSPLYHAHNASTSPERRPTSSLTPRVASRVATHNTPGFIFSQPARRQNFRHQTNSFSFDSSDRASAAYEQDRVSSLSTTDTTPRPASDIRLRDELRGSSLSSSHISTDVERQNSDTERESPEDDTTYAIADLERTLEPSSPQLPLPAPFSTSVRTVSDAESLPSLPRNRHRWSGHQRASPIRSPLESPVYEVGLVNSAPERGSPRAYHSARARKARSQPSSPYGPPEQRRASPSDTLKSSAARIVSFYRTQSPSRSEKVESRFARHPATPSRNLSVYNDSVSPASQPQTPAHVPEARHRSRYHPSYTAPVTRARAFLSVVHRTAERHERPPATPSRGRGDRAPSPAGLQAGGFRGLYGGRENGDEEQNWVAGVRFDNAEVQLWAEGEAADDGRTLRNTPEREEWRVGRH